MEQTEMRPRQWPGKTGEEERIPRQNTLLNLALKCLQKSSNTRSIKNYTVLIGSRGKMHLSLQNSKCFYPFHTQSKKIST